MEYDASESSLFIVIARIGPSIIPALAKKPELWMFVGVHFILKYIYSRSIIIPDPQSPSNGPLLAVMTNLTVIFIVMYTNNCFIRYFKLYAQVRDLLGSVIELASETRLRLKEDSTRQKMLGYTVAGIIDFFSEAGGEEDEHEAALEELHYQRLLNITEITFLRSCPRRHRYLIMFVWALDVAKMGLTSNGIQYLRFFNGLVAKVRACQQDVSDTMQMPLPWQYFHLFSVLLTVNLGLQADLAAMQCNTTSSITYVTMLLLLLGLREVSIAMSDPFGDDDVDFPIQGWLLEVFADTGVLLEHKAPWEATLKQEAAKKNDKK